MNRAAIGVCVGALVVAVACEKAPPKQPTADEILRAMNTSYATATSYADRGTVRTVFHKKDRPFVDVLTFQTAFVRGGRFRFAFQHAAAHGGSMVVWSDLTHTYTEWSIEPGVTDFGAELSLALAGATGVSKGTAYEVPSRLLPEVLRGAAQMRDLRLITNTATVDSYPCWHLAGTFAGSPVELWIDRELHLLRKIVTTHQHKTFRTETTTTYQPERNRPVDEARLQPPDIRANPPKPPPPLEPDHAWMGVFFDERTTVILDVAPGSPAEEAGLRKGDKIMKVDGDLVLEAPEVSERIKRSAIGSRVNLTIARDGQPLEVSVVLREKYDIDL